MISDFLINNKNEIYINSFLKENSFRRTDLSKAIETYCYISEITNSEITLEKWYFERTKTLSDENVFFIGSFFESESLLNIINDESINLSTKRLILKKVILIISHIIKNDSNFLIPGAIGFVIPKDPSINKILVLAGEFIDRICMNSPNYANMQGIYIRKGLSTENSALFTRSVLAYKAVCNKFPFNEENLEKRQMDIFDKNFIPIQFQEYFMDKTFADSINAGLCISDPQRIIPGERRFESQKEKEKRESYKTLAEKLDINLLDNIGNISNNNNSEIHKIEKQKKSYLRKQKINVLLNRFFRIYKNNIIITALVTIVAITALYNYQKQNSKLATSMGLSSFETVQTLYTGIHKADVPLIKEISKGRNMKSLTQIVSGFYVTMKQRLSLNEKDNTVSPATWLRLKGNTTFWQYGITNLIIDNTECLPNFTYPTRGDKKQSIAITNNLALKKGEQITHNVKYNLVHYDGEKIIVVNTADEDVTLTWNGKRWLVTNIEGTTKNKSYKLKKYKEDLKQALEKSNDDLQQTITLLKTTYNFVPRVDELFIAGVALTTLPQI